MKKLEKLSEIVHEYNTYVIDLWGVMHDGIKLNTKAIEAVENLEKKSKKIIFLSNAPKPSKKTNYERKITKQSLYFRRSRNASITRK